MKTKITAAEARLLFAFFAVLFLVFFRPLEALRLDVYNPDSACYADWLYRFFGGNFWNCKSNYYYPGATLLWIPSAALGYALAFLTGIPAADWIEPLVGLTTFSAFCVAIWVNVCSFRVISKKSLSTPLLLCLASPVLPYASIHTFLAHSGEFLFTSLFLNQLLNKRLGPMLVFAALTTLTRPTGALTVLMTCGFLVDDYFANRENSMVLAKKNRGWFVVAGLAVVAMLLKVAIGGYGSKKLGIVYPSDLYLNISWLQFERFLFGDRNGMIVTGVWWLTLLATSLLFIRKIGWTSRAVIAWMGIMGLFCIGWGGNGSQGGWFIFYRYLTSTYLGALLLWVELEPKLPTYWAKALHVLLGWQALIVAYLTWMNNYAVPRVWDPVLLNSTWAETFSRHMALVLFTPVPVALFSWWPSLSRAVYRGDHFVFGPRLWILTTIVLVASFFVVRWLRKPSGAGKKLVPSPT